MKKVYLACPYTHEDEAVRAERFTNASRTAAALMRNEGHIVYSPISHEHPLASLGQLPEKWEFWKEHCKTFLECSDAIFVLDIQSVESICSVQAEMDLFCEAGKELRFIKPEDLGLAEGVPCYP